MNELLACLKYIIYFSYDIDSVSVLVRILTMSND